MTTKRGSASPPLISTAAVSPPGFGSMPLLSGNSPLLGAARPALDEMDGGIQTLIQLHRAVEAAAVSASAGASGSGGNNGITAGSSLLAGSGVATSPTSNASGAALAPLSSLHAGSGSHWPGGAPHGSPSVQPTSSTTNPSAAWFYGAILGGSPINTRPSSPSANQHASSSQAAIEGVSHSPTSNHGVAGDPLNNSTSGSSHSVGSSTVVAPGPSPAAAVVVYSRGSASFGLHGGVASQLHGAQRSGRTGPRGSTHQHNEPPPSPLQHARGGVSAFRRPSLLPPPLDLVPPYRFALVEEGVYRGAYPVLRNFPFLQTLKLKTIVQLTPEEPTFDLASFAAAYGIEVIHIQAERFKGEAQLLPEDLGIALKTLINVEKHPVYLHCLDGRQVSGLVLMALRKLMLWDIGANHLEYRRFAKSSDDEVAFITDYNGPIEVPLRVPRWLWGGSWVDANGSPKPRLHHQIRLKFPAVAAAAATTHVPPIASVAPAATSGDSGRPPNARSVSPRHSDAAARVTSPFAASLLSRASGASARCAEAVNVSDSLLLPPPANALRASAGADTPSSLTISPYAADATRRGGGVGAVNSSASASVVAAELARFGTPGAGSFLGNSPHGSSNSSFAASASTATPQSPQAGGGGGRQPPAAAPKPFYIHVEDIAPLPLLSSSETANNAYRRTAPRGQGSGQLETSGGLESELAATYTARDSRHSAHGDSASNSVVAGTALPPAERERGTGAGASLRRGSAAPTDSDTSVGLRESVDSVAGSPVSNGRGTPMPQPSALSLGGSGSTNHAHRHTYDNISLAASSPGSAGGLQAPPLQQQQSRVRTNSHADSTRAGPAVDARCCPSALLTVSALVAVPTASTSSASSPRPLFPQQQQQQQQSMVDGEGGGSRKTKRRASL